MSEAERALILVLTSVSILASFAEETTVPEKAFLFITPLLMWAFWRGLSRHLKHARGALERRAEPAEDL
jgi:hypothetical protein